MTALTPARQNTTQLFVIDKNIDSWRDLVNNAGIGVSVLLLDPFQDGLTQIADAITAYTNLDAIHILSHGSVASLQLGSATLNSENLNHYTEQLTTIGNALSENGDLLLYGCNVAQGDTGQAFIEQLATATGADVAASDDLTGGTGTGGDGQLEYETGTVETMEISLSDYSYSLATTTSNFAFSADNIEIFGAHYEKELLNFGPDINNYALGVSTAGVSVYTNASLNTDFSLKFEADLGSLRADIDYPIQVSAFVSDMVKAGDYAIIDTSSYLINGASVLGNFALASVGLTFDSTVDLLLDGIWAGIPLLDVTQKLSDVKYDPDSYTTSTNLAKLGFSGTEISLSSDFLDVSLHTPTFLEKDILNGLFTISAGIPGEITGTTDTDTNTAGDQALNANASLASVSALGISDNALLGASLNIDQAVEWAIHKIPLPAAQAFSFSAALPPDNPLTPNVNEYDESSYGTKVTLFEASLDLGLKAVNKWTFIPDPVTATMTSTLGETHTGELGDTFAFRTPTTGLGAFDVNATYNLSGKLVSQFGVVLQLGWS
jgi:hypothetical protein